MCFRIESNTKPSKARTYYKVVRADRYNQVKTQHYPTRYIDGLVVRAKASAWSKNQFVRKLGAHSVSGIYVYHSAKAAHAEARRRWGDLIVIAVRALPGDYIASGRADGYLCSTFKKVRVLREV